MEEGCVQRIFNRIPRNIFQFPATARVDFGGISPNVCVIQCTHCNASWICNLLFDHCHFYWTSTSSDKLTKAKFICTILFIKHFLDQCQTPKLFFCFTNPHRNCLHSFSTITVKCEWFALIRFHSNPYESMLELVRKCHCWNHTITETFNFHSFLLL